ncbi:hypothetical protein OOK58_42590 [Streptomyces sp. NBC_01728]|uniref:hypothetical protein n=1 Tax=unclassified Streptomyces TaxID=2593676 RepID=UPI00224D65C5|nr:MULTISPECIES: hypothetical protein [unclassified Streptomyces]MCX4458601.1 hypothetical protein [Streptomyces sp. NBC_01719]MCX4497958.1 hypothetical protein [Streptomyces sp. NBC_01728]
MVTTTAPTATATVPAADLEAGTLVWLDGAARRVFEATAEGDCMRLRIDGFPGRPFSIPATWTYTVHTPIAPTWVRASELEAGVQIRLDGAIRRVFEAVPDGDSVRLRIEGFTGRFTASPAWEYAAYLTPAARAA